LQLPHSLLRRKWEASLSRDGRPHFRIEDISSSLILHFPPHHLSLETSSPSPLLKTLFEGKVTRPTVNAAWRLPLPRGFYALVFPAEKQIDSAQGPRRTSAQAQHQFLLLQVRFPAVNAYEDPITTLTQHLSLLATHVPPVFIPIHIPDKREVHLILHNKIILTNLISILAKIATNLSIWL